MRRICASIPARGSRWTAKPGRCRRCWRRCGRPTEPWRRFTASSSRRTAAWPKSRAASATWACPVAARSGSAIRGRRNGSRCARGSRTPWPSCGIPGERQGLAVAATLSAGRIAGVEIPAQVREAVLVQDRDAAGERAWEALQARFAGSEVRVSRALPKGKDANDDLRGAGHAAGGARPVDGRVRRTAADALGGGAASGVRGVAGRTRRDRRRSDRPAADRGSGGRGDGPLPRISHQKGLHGASDSQYI